MPLSNAELLIISFENGISLQDVTVLSDRKPIKVNVT
ncbi:MAG: hypothetical protein ACI81W_002948 [Saprospiraceae bacterium]|jgi:hypothetical protein